MPRAQVPRIGFIPYSLDTNEYCTRMIAVLERLGRVEAVPRPKLRNLVKAIGRARLDVAFVSWYENRMLDARGAVSVRSVCKVLLRTLALRAHARKLIMIRHNRFPHATRSVDQKLAQRLVDLYERALFDAALTHSPVEVTSDRLYCPHPLYRVHTLSTVPAALAAFGTETFYVVFGRIEPYKQLEQLIETFPRDKRLVICGRASDPQYVDALKRAAPANVTVLQGFLPDAEAQWLIRRAAGVVINHASKDMVVSASFFYAMSVAARVYAVETPFLRWSSDTLGERLVVVAQDLPALCARLSAATSGEPVPHDAELVIQQHFGDDNVAQYLQRLLERVGLHVRSLETYSGGKSPVLCSSQRGDTALRS